MAQMQNLLLHTKIFIRQKIKYQQSGQITVYSTLSNNRFHKFDLYIIVTAQHISYTRLAIKVAVNTVNVTVTVADELNLFL